MALKRGLKHSLWIVPGLLFIVTTLSMYRAARERMNDNAHHIFLNKPLRLTSKSFSDEESMPAVLTCRGEAKSPHLAWTNAPDGTKSYALVAMDWDAPSPKLRLFPVVHWILYNIPKNVTEIPEGASNSELDRMKIATGLSIGRADGYVGPCPPLGRHRYEFRVYALDVDELRPEEPDRGGIFEAMKGHVLGYGQITGLFGR